MIKQRQATIKTASATLLYSEMGDVVVNTAAATTQTLPTGSDGLWYHIHNIGAGVVTISNGSTMTTLAQYESAVLLYNTVSSAWCYTKGGSGGGGAVDSVNGESGAVVLDAADIDIIDTGGLFAASDVEGALSELFTSVSDGKDGLVTDIEIMGGTVEIANSHATFEELGAGILSIPTGLSEPATIYTKATSTSSLSLSANVWGTVSWNTSIVNTPGFWSSGAATRLTVPAGVNTVNILTQLIFTNSSSGSRGIKIIKNGTTEVVSRTQGARNESCIQIESGAISVAEGDYFEVQAYSTVSGISALGNGSWPFCNFVMMEDISVVDVTCRRTRVSVNADITGVSGWVELTWGKILIDHNAGACWNVSAPKKLTVPSGYTKARIRLLLHSSYYAGNVLVWLEGVGYCAADMHSVTTVGYTFFVDTGWVEVTGAQSFLSSLYFDSTAMRVTGVSGGVPSWFEIELAL